MSKPASFIIPAGLIFEQGDDGLSIEHQGDVILHSTLGLPLKRVRSAEGDIELHVDAENLSELSAGGSVRIHGAVTATRITAERIEIYGDAQVDHLEAGTGGLHIDGSTVAHEINSGGSIEVTGDAEAASLSAGGDLTINGTTQADLISTDSGDIDLAGVTAKAIACGGNLSVSGSLEVDEATAVSGSLSATGSVTAKLLRAGSVSLSGESITVSAIQGISSISISGSQIRSDILIAPSVQLAPEVSGKITVVETHGDPGPSSVKGCLSLTDLEEFGVDTSSYLSDRHLSPLGEPGEAPAVEEPEAEEVEESAEAVVEPEAEEEVDVEEEAEAEPDTEDEAITDIDIVDEDEDEDEASSEDASDPLEEPTQAEVISIDDMAIEALDDELADIDIEDDHGANPLSVVVSVEGDDAEISIEDDDLGELEALELSPLEDDDSIAEVFDLTADEPAEEDDPLYTQLRDTITQIESCYEGNELPPAVTQLGKLADARNYIAIRDDITNIWHQLLKFHQKRGLRIQPQVTTTFNTINTLVRKI